MRILIDHFHEQLVKDTISERLSDDDAMLLFYLLHCYEIEVLPEVFESRSGSSIVAPTTQRYAGQVIASLYRNRKKKRDDHRADYLHWYWKWNADWGYEKAKRPARRRAPLGRLGSAWSAGRAGSFKAIGAGRHC